MKKHVATYKKYLCILLSLIMLFINGQYVVAAISIDSSFETSYFKNEYSTDSRLAVECHSYFIDRITEKYGYTYPESYSGAYIDSDQNLVICLKSDSDKSELKSIFSESVITSLKEKFLKNIGVRNTSQAGIAYNEKKIVYFEEKKYSFNQLYNAFKTLQKLIDNDEYGIQYVSFTQRSNQVTVYICDSKYIAALDEYISNSNLATCKDAIYIITEPLNLVPVNNLDIPNEANSVEASTTTSTKYLYAGNHVYNATSGGGGTVGFNAYDYITDRYGVVTCEHVVGSGEVATDYHANIIGNGLSNKVSTSLDATFIPFASTGDINWQTSTSIRLQNTTSSGDIVKIAQSVSSGLEGETVYKFGMRTGYTSGTILNVYAATSPNVAFIQTSCHAYFGDSGSALLKRSSSSSLTMCDLVGIMQSIRCVDKEDPTTFIDSFAVKIKPILFTLDLSPVTTTSEFRVGDLDNDGQITSTDARLVSGAVNGTYMFTSAANEIADVNMDGLVSDEDATLILQKFAGSLSWLT